MPSRIICRSIAAAAALSLALLAGCQSPNLDQRIAKDQEQFESWPPEVREAVAEGKIDVGFTREQVRMALGEPSYIRLETSEAGKFENWYYEKDSPALNIGLGLGSFGRNTGVSTGVGTTVGGDTKLLAFVSFQQGEVVSFEVAGD